MKLGYYGLGKMGYNMVLRLHEAGHEVIAANRSSEPRMRIAGEGIEVAESLAEMVEKLEPPRLVWLMVPYTAVDAVLDELMPLLETGDTVIDGGNSPYVESMNRAETLAEHGIAFLDVGVSGGPSGARNGACVMVGGERDVYDAYEQIFADIAAPDAYAYLGQNGAGHFVKMVHNGIEYGMMQSIAEGFTVLKDSSFNLSLSEIARVYNNQSVISSRLIGWLKDAFKQHGEALEHVSGSVEQNGEGEWTVQAAKDLSVSAEAIKAAVEFRKKSQSQPSFEGKILSAMREQFGGHEVEEGN